MKKVLLGMAALAFFAASCTDKSDVVTPDPPKTEEWYLTGIVVRDIDNSGGISADKDSMTITYNTDKTFSTLEEITGENAAYYALVKLVYNQQKITKVTLQESKTGAAETIYECTYSGDQLIRFFEPGFAATSYDSLVYENNKVVKVFQVRADKRNNKSWEYTWQNNNVTEVREFEANPVTYKLELASIEKYTYNTVANPYKPLANFLLLKGDNPDIPLLSANEQTSYTVANAQNVVSHIYSYTRSVNDKGLTVADTMWHKTPAESTAKADYISAYKYTDLNK
ncbi:hypothetical protein AB6805_15395 [Chitinophaga sp. RCC_12]|uniref:hypothetical protein n=1 Tax=Chitinophaga sp. RCC_12 TaxID=3239226 RepID=UPI003525D4A5